MKLLHRYSRISLLTSIIIFLLGGAAFYFSVRYVLIKQVDKELKEEQHELEDYVLQSRALPPIVPYSDEITTYTATAAISSKDIFRSMKITDTDANVLYRSLTFFVRTGDKNYFVTVAKSLENTEELILSVVLISATTILLLLVAGFILNRILLRRLWKPFYESMHLIKNYRVGREPYPVFATTDIDEFSELNETLNDTVRNSENEYRSLKEFTENASHEMQTPVAVIRSKMDVMIQDEALTEAQSISIKYMYDAVNSLARLHQSLLLLTKIENRQFTEKEHLQMNVLLHNKINYFNEIVESKSLEISRSIAHAVIEMNASLADVLLNNLFSNAIKHSQRGGKINVTLDEKKLVISNGPFEKALDDALIFKRFYKGGNSNEEHGLGLAIVQEICSVSGFVASYSFDKYMHSFAIVF